MLDAGRIVEYDKPLTLLENPSSRFYALCRATGKTEFRIVRLTSLINTKDYLSNPQDMSFLSSKRWQKAKLERRTNRERLLDVRAKSPKQKLGLLPCKFTRSYCSVPSLHPSFFDLIVRSALALSFHLLSAHDRPLSSNHRGEKK